MTIMLLAVTALAAQAQGVMITGKVTTTDGECIGATVVEQDKGGRIVSSAVTDINGNYYFNQTAEAHEAQVDELKANGLFPG